MEKYTKILVAVDGSDSSKNAFRQACKIAMEDNGQITVVTVIPLYADQFETLNIKENVSKTLTENGKRILSEIEDIAAEEQVVIKTRLEEGNAFETIIDVAEEGRFDLIIMGRRGKTRLEKVLMGSVTAKVIGHSQRDILIVPRDTSLGRNILLATDGSKYSRGAAERAIAIAKSYNCNLRVVSAVDIGNGFEAEGLSVENELLEKARKVVNEVKKMGEAQGVSVETQIKEGEIYDVITILAKEYNSSIIIMGSHGRTGIRRLLMGSVVERVIGYAPCPVLVIKK